jgi:FkbM family methyltransferase
VKNVVFHNLRRAVKFLFPEIASRVRERRSYVQQMTGERDATIEFLVPFVAGKTFIDIGAHQGSYTFHLKRHADKVLAFEPIESLAHLIERHNPSVQVLTCALGDKAGEASMFVPNRNGREVLTRCSLVEGANPGFENELQPTSVCRLDDFNLSNVGAIKIDVEGHELAVIKGAISTIHSSRPVLAIEIEERHHPGQSWEIIDQVRELGYECFFFDQNHSLTPVSDFDFSLLQNSDNLPDPFTGEGGLYLNDFVFLPHQLNT